MSLLARIDHHEARPVEIRRCVDCQVHEAIADGNRCHDCLNAYMRETSPRVTVSPFVARALAHELPAKQVA